MTQRGAGEAESVNAQDDVFPFHLSKVSNKRSLGPAHSTHGKRESCSIEGLNNANGSRAVCFHRRSAPKPAAALKTGCGRLSYLHLFSRKEVGAVCFCAL